MLVPEFWAEARLCKRIKGRQTTIKRFGWSDSSESDARKHAEKRVQAALASAESGARINKREPKRPYNGAEGVPIREEIVSRHGSSVITRNSYGALCINTPDVLFADLDFETQPGVRFYLLIYVLLLLMTGYLGFINSSWSIFLAAGVLVLVMGVLVADLLFRLILAFGGGAERRAGRRIRKFAGKHPDWHLRVYRTPAGYRILVMHHTFDPNDSVTLGFLKQLKSDPLYVRMCRNQRCFRARISPKPWRIGIETHMKPRPGVWPVNPDRLAERNKWVEHYEKVAKRFASCRFVEKLGSDVVDSHAQVVRRIHDDYCRSDSGLKIA